MVEPVFTAPPKYDATRLAAQSWADLHVNASAYCQDCHHVGWIFTESLAEFADGGWYDKAPCRCNVHGNAADTTLLREAGIPVIYLGATLGTWQNTGRTPTEKSKNEKAIERARRMASDLPAVVADGLCLWIHGSSGTGKTWVACAILREALLQWRMSGRFFMASRLVAVAVNEPALLADLYEVDWLVLDGIDKVPETRSGYDTTVLQGLIEHRIQNKKPTIFTASMAIREAEGFVGLMKEALVPIAVEFHFVGQHFAERASARSRWEA